MLGGRCAGGGENMGTSTTERLGIAELTKIFAQVGWYFREQFVSDNGIDAQVEIVENNKPTGQLIAIQVKSGMSYFSEMDEEKIIYRPKANHVEYWTKHSLPVIICLHNTDNDKVFWTPVLKERIISTGKGYKIEISTNSTLTKENCLGLSRIFKFNYHEYRLNKLLLDSSWMKLIMNGESVYAEFEDWHNKSLSRTSITISCELVNGSKSINLPTLYAPGYSALGIVQKTIPWASFEMDIDSHREAQKDEYETECYTGYDKKDDMRFYYESFDEWYEEPDDIVPIKRESEIDIYRVKLTLNDLGKAFLNIYEYLDSDPEFELTSFSITEIFS